MRVVVATAQTKVEAQSIVDSYHSRCDGIKVIWSNIDDLQVTIIYEFTLCEFQQETLKKVEKLAKKCIRDSYKVSNAKEMEKFRKQEDKIHKLALYLPLEMRLRFNSQTRQALRTAIETVELAAEARTEYLVARTVRNAAEARMERKFRYTEKM